MKLVYLTCWGIFDANWVMGEPCDIIHSAINRKERLAYLTYLLQKMCTLQFFEARLRSLVCILAKDYHFWKHRIHTSSLLAVHQNYCQNQYHCVKRYIISCITKRSSDWQGSCNNLCNHLYHRSMRRSRCWRDSSTRSSEAIVAPTRPTSCSTAAFIIVNMPTSVRIHIKATCMEKIKLPPLPTSILN